MSVRARLVLVISVGLLGCGESKKGVSSWPDGLLPPDGGLQLDGRVTDLGTAPDLLQNKDGPRIEILTPKEGETVIGEVLKVRAKITHPDGVDDQSVKLTVQGREPVKMSATATPEEYEAIIDITAYVDQVRIWVQAADLTGRQNSLIRNFKRDPGPVIQFLSPSDGSRHKGSVSIQILVGDKSKPVTLFELRVGTEILKLQSKPSGTNKTLYTGTVKFDDPVFQPPLSGKQVLTAVAENENKARTTAQRTFFVDNEGPAISIKSQGPGQLVGGLITIAATISDPAGVVASSVRAVIGNKLDTRNVVLKVSPADPTLYEAQFDTRTLSQYDLWPVLSVRASDQLGNESHEDIELGLDNGPPLLEMFPTGPVYQARTGAGGLTECSRPFPPLGTETARDLNAVPQIAYLRAYAEDQGNHVPSAPWVPVALINKTSVKMYVLDDTSKPVVVDTNGDGFCDSINPEIIPLGSTPVAGQAVAVALQPIPVGGVADFRPVTPPVPIGLGKTFPFPICSDGIAVEAPAPLCATTSLTVAVNMHSIGGEPALYAVPPVIVGDNFKCIGLPFDFLANQISDGWVCVAVTGMDNLGNIGVSKPMRLWVDKKSLTVGPGPLPANAGTPPDCTGTLDVTTGKVGSKPCTFRPPGVQSVFPQTFVGPRLVKR